MKWGPEPQEQDADQITLCTAWVFLPQHLRADPLGTDTWDGIEGHLQDPGHARVLL